MLVGEVPGVECGVCGDENGKVIIEDAVEDIGERGGAESFADHEPVLHEYVEFLGVETEVEGSPAGVAFGFADVGDGRVGVEVSPVEGFCWVKAEAFQIGCGRDEVFSESGGRDGAEVGQFSGKDPVESGAVGCIGVFAGIDHFTAEPVEAVSGPVGGERRASGCIGNDLGAGVPVDEVGAGFDPEPVVHAGDGSDG
ncbi:MAG: hypothetical protein RI897_3295 [Verrucomicrobiota bacterium]